MSASPSKPDFMGSPSRLNLLTKTMFKPSPKKGSLSNLDVDGTHSPSPHKIAWKEIAAAAARLPSKRQT